MNKHKQQNQTKKSHKSMIETFYKYLILESDNFDLSNEWTSPSLRQP